MVVCERCFPFDRFGGSTPSQTLAIPFSIFLRRFYQDSDLCAADPRSRSKSIRFICNNSVASHRIVCFVFHSLIIFIGDVVFRNVGIINLFEAFLALPASSRLEIFLSFFTIFSLICVWIRNRISVFYNVWLRRVEYFYSFFKLRRVFPYNSCFLSMICFCLFIIGSDFILWWNSVVAGR